MDVGGWLAKVGQMGYCNVYLGCKFSEEALTDCSTWNAKGIFRFWHLLTIINCSQNLNGETISPESCSAFSEQ